MAEGEEFGEARVESVTSAPLHVGLDLERDRQLRPEVAVFGIADEQARIAAIEAFFDILDSILLLVNMGGEMWLVARFPPRLLAGQTERFVDVAETVAMCRLRQGEIERLPSGSVALTRLGDKHQVEQRSGTPLLHAA